MRARATRVLILGATMILIAWGMTEILGWRESTSILTRLDVLEQPSSREVARVVLYLTTYALAVTVAPVLLIAAVIRELLARVCEGDRRGAIEEEHLPSR